MVSASYLPDRGEVVWLHQTPQAGHEQAGRRPALVLSGRDFNDRTGFAFVCPITDKGKGYPFEVPVPANSGAYGVILADQARSLDWAARNAERMGRVPSTTVQDVLYLIATILEI